MTKAAKIIQATFIVLMLNASGPDIYAMQFSNFVFEMPSGWHHVQKGDRIYLTPPNYNRYPLTIVVLPGKQTNNFVEWFESTVTSYLAPYSLRHLNPTEIHVNDDGNRVLSKDAFIETTNPFTRLTRFIGTEYKDQGGLIAIIYNSPISYSHHLSTIIQFQCSLQSRNFPPRSQRSPCSHSAIAKKAGPTAEDVDHGTVNPSIQLEPALGSAEYIERALEQMRNRQNEDSLKSEQRAKEQDDRIQEEYYRRQEQRRDEMRQDQMRDILRQQR